ncbi:hypothetical protein [Rubinisphaera italica]|uniref:Uncharacterized protein n=1 Tax=Rubinisphaera italica TaxID=2527969 RepID=A0A5C5XL90_9PLAN|nr:hypothetical protein [Rubinisphaera italica]TWT63173.1 hypothetical protein Pan54_39260 [Rubinisphaera italica]
MSLSHHNEEMSGETRKLFESQKGSAERLYKQKNRTAQRAWPEGRIGASDDGELAFAIGAHPEKELVCIDFGKPVTWTALSPQQAVELAQCLIKQARAVSSVPLRVHLH